MNKWAQLILNYTNFFLKIYIIFKSALYLVLGKFILLSLLFCPVWKEFRQTNLSSYFYYSFMDWPESLLHVYISLLATLHSCKVAGGNIKLDLASDHLLVSK